MDTYPTTERSARLCPRCGYDDCRVYWGYDREDGARVRRRRCASCGARFETVELLDHIVEERHPRKPLERKIPAKGR